MTVSGAQRKAKMAQVIETIREAEDNEFFFRAHDNLGMSDEFKRFIKYINQHSDIEIVRIDTESVQQMKQSDSSMHGSPFNFKVITK